MHRRFVLLILAMGLCFGPAAHAANIILVNETYDTDANGSQDDLGLEEFLVGLGHQVDVRRGNWTALDAAKIATLNAADLIVVSRSTGSGNYDDDAAEIANWNGLTAPLILLTPYLSRGTSSTYRWYWFNSNTVTNLTAPKMQVVATTHPIFKGMPLDAAGLVDVVDGTTGTGQTSFAGTIDVGSGALLARTATGTNSWIVEWQPGTPYYSGSPGTPGGKRMLFCCGTQESGATPQGAFNLTDNGRKLFANAINYMAGIEAMKTATDPVPANEATDVIRDIVLGWTPNAWAATHNVYFGTDADAVANADVAQPLGVLASRGQNANTYTLPSVLEFGRTYYWRIDEVNAAPDFTVFKGEVWSFTVEPVSYPVQNVTVTSTSTNQTDMGPMNTVNGSGLNEDGEHGVDLKTMWVATSVMPHAIEFAFDKVYKFDEMWVWNANSQLEAAMGFGAKTVAIECSVDGETWTPVENVPEFAQGTGEPTYTANTKVDLAGAVAKYVKLTITANWGGVTPQVSLSEVRFYQIPVQAREPEPASGATGMPIDATLRWRAGREAGSHRVSFGTDQQAVADGTASVVTVTDRSFDPGSLLTGTTYFWKADEVNEAATPSVWEGEVWSFSTMEYIVVDDFESYTNDEGSRIYESWIDGMTDGASGSQVGYDNGPFAERSIVHGGKQSMPLLYDNDGTFREGTEFERTGTPYFSEAELEISPAQNWAIAGADTLSLWVRGYPAAYVEDAGVVTMTAGGHDIWGAADDFRFAYKTLTGNGSAIVKVESLVNTNAWAKAGVMIRQSLDADSKFVYMIVSAGSGVSMGNRPLAASACTSATQSGIAAPQWVKLVRTGNAFTAQYSTDGKTWTDLKNADGTVATTTVTMTDPVYVGLCVTSHNSASTTTAVMSGVQTTGTVTGDWQVATIGDDVQTSNDPAVMYVTVQDSSKKTATATNAEIVTSSDWTQWKIPLSSLAGVNARKVEKLILGVDSRNSATRGEGLIFIDDIAFGHPAE
jgi:hypothetical protein